MQFKAWLGELLLGMLLFAQIICRPLVLRHLYLAILIRLIKRTDLFDSSYYLKINQDVSVAEISPLYHYVAYGDKEGYLPLAIFDPYYYRTRAQHSTAHVNALLHYAYIGRYRSISPSPWFDVQFYISQNKDVARAGHEPLHHYIKWGGLEGRSPNSQFDGDYYLKTNPDVAKAGLNPLIHYLEVGRKLARPIRKSMEQGKVDAALGHVDELYSYDKWEALLPKKDSRIPLVDIIVPVYRDWELTLRCIYTVLTESNATPFELIVLDDCSPNKRLKNDLKRFAERGLFTLLENEQNCGFVFTANRGMRLHPERDVILLNSDTEVYNDWIDRLRNASNRHPRTATVTPLSNNAAICSYPRFLHDNPYPLELSYAKLDVLAARVNSEFDVEAPTGGSFCMYLRRDALNDVGLFDNILFGKGYGEDNDYCQRAIQKGWRNIIAANIFVRHQGGASFRGEKSKRVAAAMKVMGERHPEYHKALEKFIQQNPLAEARRRLDWMRLKAKIKTENVLIVCHNRGGGSERYLQEDSGRLQQRGLGVFYLRPERGQSARARLQHPDCRQLLNLVPLELQNTVSLSELLKEFKISRIHIHGLVDFSLKAPEKMMLLSQTLDIPLYYNIHDYEVICPRINLADRSGAYCGEPAEQKCDSCLSVQGNNYGEHSIREWRGRYYRLLRHCDKIYVPDQDVASRLARYYPKIPTVVVPHETPTSFASEFRKPQLLENERLRIVVIGGISKIKGFDVLLACARVAKKRSLPLDFIVMGYSFNDRMLERAGVVVTGRYLDQNAEEKLLRLGPHVIWLPSVWPETYSYTLSLALKVGYPVFAFNIGAIARRLTDANLAANLSPLDYMNTPAKINNRFMDFRDRHTLPSEHL